MASQAGSSATSGAQEGLSGLGFWSKLALVCACIALLAALLTPLVVDWSHYLRENSSVEVSRKIWGFTFKYTKNTLSAACDPLVWHHIVIAVLVFGSTAIATRGPVRKVNPAWALIGTITVAIAAYGLTIWLSPDGVLLILLLIPGALAVLSAVASELFGSSGPPDAGCGGVDLGIPG